MLKGRKIVVGITGSIAAYKAAVLVRLLVKAGANVRVVMTADACKFITPLSLSVLTGNPVITDLVTKDEIWNNHVELGLWGDIFLIAPATANTLAKMATGQCDNMLLAVYLSARCPICIAPAMDEDMWHHTATQNNVHALISRRHVLIPVGRGDLASGLKGEGRMAEPEDILHFVEDYFSKDKGVLNGKHILINAGPTQEAIDPVRYISNHSTGKMGVAIAEAAKQAGAEVTLIMGPVLIPMPAGITIINVTTAEEMYGACVSLFPKCDIAILSAAVADYTIQLPAQDKIKKDTETLNLALVKTKDILKALGEIKTDKQVLVGFALETTDEMNYATEKLKDKKADMIVLNSLKDVGAGFAYDTNKVTLLHKDGRITPIALNSKDQIAKDIINHVVTYL